MTYLITILSLILLLFIFIYFKDRFNRKKVSGKLFPPSWIYGTWGLSKEYSHFAIDTFTFIPDNIYHLYMELSSYTYETRETIKTNEIYEIEIKILNDLFLFRFYKVDGNCIDYQISGSGKIRLIRY